jgi:hypothetical protein
MVIQVAQALVLAKQHGTLLTLIKRLPLALAIKTGLMSVGGNVMREEINAS